MPDRDSYANGTGSSGAGPGGGSSEEASGAGTGSGGATSDAICRDFLRNVCKRGKRCRYRHPDMSEVSNLGVSKNEFIFCHDFQNKECSRPNCRFIHGSKEDEDGYKKTGELPPRLRQKVAAGLGLSPADLPNGKEEVPICRDFLKGDCQRGTKCKFRHLNPEITPLSAALAQTIAQGMAPPPVSMAPVAVSVAPVAPVAVSMAQPLAGITMSHTTTPMVTYPIASQSMRITAMPH